MNTDFSEITPCGGSCTGCSHFTKGECKGCLSTGGKCVKMWENSCEIFSCCAAHKVNFCGLCEEFSQCGKAKKMNKWNKNAAEHHQSLAAEYKKQREDFTEKLSALWNDIGTHGIMIFSTCAENRVTSRPVSAVVVEGKIYFQTDKNFLKYKQILKNENAALCVKNYSIEGCCRDMGKPLESGNSDYVNAVKEHFYNAYKNYSGMEDERLLEVTPTLIYSWSYEDTKPYMEYWDITHRTYRKEYKYN